MGETFWEDHLHAANARKARIRFVRAELQVGLITLSQALADPGVQSITVGRVIQWLPRWGPHRTDEMLQALDWPINPNRLCGDLTERQRALLEQAVKR